MLSDAVGRSSRPRVAVKSKYVACPPLSQIHDPRSLSDSFRRSREHIIMLLYCHCRLPVVGRCCYGIVLRYASFIVVGTSEEAGRRAEAEDDGGRWRRQEEEETHVTVKGQTEAGHRRRTDRLIQRSPPMHRQSQSSRHFPAKTDEKDLAGTQPISYQSSTPQRSPQYSIIR